MYPLVPLNLYFLLLAGKVQTNILWLTARSIGVKKFDCLLPFSATSDPIGSRAEIPFDMIASKRDEGIARHR